MLFQPHTEPVRVCDVSSLSLDAAHPRASRHRLLLLHNDRTASDYFLDFVMVKS